MRECTSKVKQGTTRGEKPEISPDFHPLNDLAKQRKQSQKFRLEITKKMRRKRLESDFGIILLFDQIICVYFNVYLF